MSQKYEKLKTLLKELFQLDQPDLDFGLYRIMHAKAGEVTQFLEKDLLPQVKEAFGLYKTADKSELEKELAKAIEQAQGLGVDPETTQKVKDLRAKLASDAVDIGALEQEVYDHLYSFFRRYYSEGDFLAKRVYKPGVYAVPYEGEEVKLHWANKDQYYIKTSEYLRDYAFRLRLDDDKNPMRVHFRLVDAAEGEHGNVKATEGKDRVFILTAENFVAEENGESGKELILRFEYRPATVSDWPEASRESKSKPPAQKDLQEIAEQRVLTVTNVSLAPWLAELGKPHVKVDGERAEYSRLRAHLNRYTARNTFDYFIHKDLGGFLRRELDFYIKNEVMHLDDVENETSARVEQYLSKIKVIRRIAGKIIEFLAQLEDFQKKLWLKKKFVVETQYCITLDRIQDELYPDIASNEAQRLEWVELFAIDQMPAYSAPLTTAFLSEHPGLVLNTAFFAADFINRLLSGLSDLDESISGMLVQSENAAGMSILRPRFGRTITNVFMDPPYNTGNDFIYKDAYRHSSWVAMMHERLGIAMDLLSSSGSIAITIDDSESSRLGLLLEDIAGAKNIIARIEWESAYTANQTAQFFSVVHNDIYVIARDASDLQVGKISRDDQQVAKFRNPDNDPRGPWKAENLSSGKPYSEGLFIITGPKGDAFSPPPGRYWRCNRAKFDEWLKDGRIWFGKDGKGRPYLKKYLAEVKDKGLTATSWWPHEFAGSNKQATIDLKGMAAGFEAFETPKPVLLLERLVSLLGNGDPCWVLDPFAGSGTTAHAVLNLERADEQGRKFLLIEVGEYFDTVLLPRVVRAVYASRWKEHRPEQVDYVSACIKVMRLESYEDALNNLVACRSKTQQSLLNSPETSITEGFKEQYLLRYMLDVETHGSQSLLNIQAFKDPTAYKLKVKRPGSDESREINVDLLETFNWLIGLTVQHIAAPQTFTAAFERDAEKRLRLRGRLKPVASVQSSVVSVQKEKTRESSLKTEPLNTENCFWFRTVTGTTPDGRKTLVIWRKLTDNLEEDNLVLDEWFPKQGYSTKDYEFQLIYVNGDNNLENLKAPDDTWKVRLIEEDFHRLMFDTEGV